MGRGLGGSPGPGGLRHDYYVLSNGVTGLVRWTLLVGVVIIGVIMEIVPGLTGRLWEKPQGPS